MSPRPPFLAFHERTSTSRRGRLWAVVSRVTGHEVGVVRWYAPGRCYTFQTKPRETIFGARSICEIAKFLELERQMRGAQK